MKIQCNKCKLAWDYKGHKKPDKIYSVYITCPRCRNNIKLKIR